MDDVDIVRAWRVPGEDRLLWLHGITTGYRVGSAGEYVIGMSVSRSYELTRGPTRTVVPPGQLVVLDPSAAHSGSPAEGRPWEGRLLMAELTDIEAATTDEERPAFDLDFPEPHLGGEELATRFLALHQLMERPASTLERQSSVTSFLQDVASRSPAVPRLRRRQALDDRAVRRACEYLGAHPVRNVSLDELAAAAGTSKFRLVRLFKSAFGVPPHAFQVTERLRIARRLIERGEPIAIVATTAGFVDQSHLTRHFRRRLGFTPGQYALAVGRKDVQAVIDGAL